MLTALQMAGQRSHTATGVNSQTFTNHCCFEGFEINKTIWAASLFIDLIIYNDNCLY